MAHFYGSILGQSGGEGSRLGNKQSGLKAHLAGWTVGIEVIGQYDKDTDMDVFDVYITGGSANGTKFLIGTFTEKDYDNLATQESGK